MGLYIVVVFVYGECMDFGLDYWIVYELLDWQVEFGVDEVILDVFVNCYELVDEVCKLVVVKFKVVLFFVFEKFKVDQVVEVQKVVDVVKDIDVLKVVIFGFEYCYLCKGVCNCIVFVGNLVVWVMIVIELFSCDDDWVGMLLLGQVGVFFDKMFVVIDLG